MSDQDVMAMEQFMSQPYPEGFEEKECPLCGALNRSDHLERYQGVSCHGCGEVLEYDGHGFWFVD